MQQTSSRSKAALYILLCFFLWVVIDLGTAGGFRLSYFCAHGLLLLAFYVGYPLVFGFLIFKRHWKGWRLFLATIVTVLLIEGLLSRNPIVLSFPLLLVGIPLALCIYAPLTYFPLWIINGEIGEHKRVGGFLSLIVLAVMILTTFGGR